MSDPVVLFQRVTTFNHAVLAADHDEEGRLLHIAENGNPVLRLTVDAARELRSTLDLVLDVAHQVPLPQAEDLPTITGPIEIVEGEIEPESEQDCA